MDNKKRARVIITEVVNLALNRHIHALSDAGYLRVRKHTKDYRFDADKSGRALRLKQELIEEMCKDPVWPVSDSTLLRAGGRAVSSRWRTGCQTSRISVS